MTQGRIESRTKDVRRMFGRIAPRYDLLNRLITFGQDQRWRKSMITSLCLPPQSFVLDLGAGTGDLAFETIQQHPDAFIVAADLTPEMILHGKQRDQGCGVQWIIADADHLPFDSGTFDAVVSGFLLRNLQNLDRSLADQVRVLRDRGQWTALDTTPPANGVLKPFIRIYLHFAVPFLGFLIAGDLDAYRYLPQSTERFLRPQALLERLRGAGIIDEGYQQRMFGSIAIYHGHKS
ncbi:MAG: ubiquinone/menaquinone biosynthesis methyltransferase [Anaerolineales bacterium]|nr:ubiquinone/menaquinone biosynthesis methyltransferase [Anaerolineales bacterium]